MADYEVARVPSTLELYEKMGEAMLRRDDLNNLFFTPEFRRSPSEVKRMYYDEWYRLVDEIDTLNEMVAVNEYHRNQSADQVRIIDAEEEVDSD